MDAPELARWTRFAAKGGIGRCTAISDCVAEAADDLMFLKDDEITVLMMLPDAEDTYLGYCEGVVGRFTGAHVRIHGKLKKPVMTKRPSSANGSRSASSASMFSSTSASTVNQGYGHGGQGSMGGTGMSARSPPPPSPSARAFDTPSPGLSPGATSAFSSSLGSPNVVAPSPSASSMSSDVGYTHRGGGGIGGQDDDTVTVSIAVPSASSSGGVVGSRRGLENTNTKDAQREALGLGLGVGRRAFSPPAATSGRIASSSSVSRHPSGAASIGSTSGSSIAGALRQASHVSHASHASIPTSLNGTRIPSSGSTSRPSSRVSSAGTGTGVGPSQSGTVRPDSQASLSRSMSSTSVSRTHMPSSSSVGSISSVLRSQSTGARHTPTLSGSSSYTSGFGTTGSNGITGTTGTVGQRRPAAEMPSRIPRRTPTPELRRYTPEPRMPTPEPPMPSMPSLPSMPTRSYTPDSQRTTPEPGFGPASGSRPNSVYSHASTPSPEPGLEPSALRAISSPSSATVGLGQERGHSPVGSLSSMRSATSRVSPGSLSASTSPRQPLSRSASSPSGPTQLDHPSPSSASHHIHHEPTPATNASSHTHTRNRISSLSRPSITATTFTAPVAASPEPIPEPVRDPERGVEPSFLADASFDQVPQPPGIPPGPAPGGRYTPVDRMYEEHEDNKEHEHKREQSDEQPLLQGQAGQYQYLDMDQEETPLTTPSLTIGSSAASITEPSLLTPRATDSNANSASGLGFGATFAQAQAHARTMFGGSQGVPASSEVSPSQGAAPPAALPKRGESLAARLAALTSGAASIGISSRAGAGAGAAAWSDSDSDSGSEAPVPVVQSASTVSSPTVRIDGPSSQPAPPTFSMYIDPSSPSSSPTSPKDASGTFTVNVTAPDSSLANGSHLSDESTLDSPDPHASHLRRLMPKRQSALRATAYRDSTFDSLDAYGEGMEGGEGDRNSRLRFSHMPEEGGTGLNFLQNLVEGWGNTDGDVEGGEHVGHDREEGGTQGDVNGHDEDVEADVGDTLRGGRRASMSSVDSDEDSWEGGVDFSGHTPRVQDGFEMEDETMRAGDADETNVGRRRVDSMQSFGSSEAHLPFDRPESIASSHKGSSGPSTVNGHSQSSPPNDYGHGHARSPSGAPSVVSQSNSNTESDGMSIYDNYRYSRYSMASKASRNSFSSIHPGEAPPMPDLPTMPSSTSTPALERADPLRQDSSDTIQSVPGLALRSRKNSLRINVPPQSPPSPTQVTAPLTPRSKKKQQAGAAGALSGFAAEQEAVKTKSRPAPLELQPPSPPAPEATPSPLLHATFGSPLSTAFTDMSSGPRSSTSTYSEQSHSDVNSRNSRNEGLSPRLSINTSPETTAPNIMSTLSAQVDREMEAFSPARSDMSVSPNLDDFPAPNYMVPDALSLDDIQGGVEIMQHEREDDSPSLEPDNQAHLRPQFRAMSVQEIAAEVETRFSMLSRASRASSTAGEGFPIRQFDAHKEPLPRIQVESIHVSQQVFTGQMSPEEDLMSAVSAYPMSALPSFGASFTPSSPTTPTTPSPRAANESPIASPPSPLSPTSPTSPMGQTQKVTLAPAGTVGAIPRGPKDPGPYFGSSRTSLFAPHPNAPRAPPRHSVADQAGPLYGRKSTVMLDQPPLPPSAPMGSSIHVMRIAYGVAYAPPGPGELMRRPPPTIYALTAIDLSEAYGPVPVTFSLEPPNAVPAQRIAIQRAMTGDSTTSGSDPGSNPSSRRPSVSTPAAALAAPPISVTNAQNDLVANAVVTAAASAALSRPGFTPQAPGMRPRSRSFSAVEKPVVSPAPAMPNKTQDDMSGPAPSRPNMTRSSSALAGPPVAAPIRPSSTGPLSRSTSAMAAPSPSASPPKASRSVSARPSMSALRPSPLSLPQNNTLAKSPSGPHVFAPSPLAGDGPKSPTRPGLREVKSSIQLRGGVGGSSNAKALSPPTSPNKLRAPGIRRTSDAGRPPMPTSPSATSIHHEYRASVASSGGRSDGDPETSDGRSLMSPPLLRGSFSTSPMHSRNASVRSKLSVSALRPSKNGSPSAPPTPTEENMGSGSAGGFDVVQVKDADFELVTPSAIGSSSARGSFDSRSVVGNGVAQPDSARSDGSDRLRPGTPAMSPGLARPLSPTSTKSSQKAIDDEKQQTEAHRRRELQWIQLLAATPAGQVRKSKKTRRLLLEGVPSSVRSVVWSNMVDVPSRRMEGVYEKLGGRGRVPASAQIQRDLALLFPGRPAYWDPTGPLATLLQAYLTMVPDVLYHNGLALVAGYLLDQGPEEDAFWTFASVMDMHMRGYFSPNAGGSGIPMQLEVDAALFSRALEAVDPALVKKLFVQLQLQPTKVCEPWFTSIFANALPTDFMVRVWDIFLLDGPLFLLRVGLAIAQCARNQLMQCPDARKALALLARPPVEDLPADVEAFIGLAMGIKMKEDDMLKQRAKMEARLKASQHDRRPGGGVVSKIAGLGISIRR